MRCAALLVLLLAAAPVLAQSGPEAEPPPGSVTGFVTDAETGRALAGAGVMLPDLGIGAISDRQGRFVIDGVPAGTHTVRAGAYTYHLATFSVETVDGQAAALDTPLRPGAGVGCEVVHDHDAAGGLHNTGG